MIKKYAQLLLLALLIASPAFGQGMQITETRTFGMVEVIDSAPTTYSNHSGRTFVISDERIAYPGDTTLLQMVRILRQTQLSSGWSHGSWYAIPVEDARTLLAAIRSLDDIQARLARFNNEGADRTAEARFTFSIVDASNRDYVGSIERFSVTATSYNLPMMFSAEDAIKKLPEGEQPAAKRRALEEFADLLEQAIDYLDRD